MSSVGERLVQIRKDLHLNQVAFAKLLHISRSQLGNLETGKRELNEQTIHILCSECHINKEWLLSGTGKQYNQAVIDSIETADSARGQQPLDSDGDKKAELMQYAAILLHQFKNISYSCENIEEFLSFLSYPSFADQVGYISSIYSKALSDPASSILTLKLFNALFERVFDLTKESKKLKNAGKSRSRNFQEDDLTEYAEDYCKDILYDVLDFGNEEEPRSVAGLAAGGSPLYEECDSEETVPVPPKYLDRDRYFIVKVKGHSMEPKIMDGDYAVVERNTPPFPNEIALVRVIDAVSEEGYVIKKYVPVTNGVELRSFNPDYPPQHYARSALLSAERIVYIIHSQN